MTVLLENAYELKPSHPQQRPRREIGAIPLKGHLRYPSETMEVPAIAGAAFLLPGLVNGYGKIDRRSGAIEGRLSRIERTLSTLPLQDADRGSGCSGGIEAGG